MADGVPDAAQARSGSGRRDFPAIPRGLAAAGALVTAAILGLAGCTADRSTESGWQISTDTLPGGVAVVVNSPPADGIRPTWRIEPEVVIGAIEGGGPDAFGEVKGIAPLPDGRVAVLDAQAQEIRIFAADGRFERTLGGRGEGPGELSDANGMIAGPDGLLRVNDPSNARLSIFDPDEGFVASERLDVYAWGFIWDAYGAEDGRIYQPTLTMLDDERWNAIKVYDATGEWVDTVRIERYEPTPPGESRSSFYYEAGPVRGFIGVPYYPRAARTLDPQGYFWRKGEDNDYRVARTTFDGDTTLLVESRRPALPVSAAERDSAIAAIRERARGADLDWSRIPEEKPIVEALYLDDGKRLWVRVHASDTRTTFDVFSPAGRYEGTAVTTLNIPPHWRPAIVGDRMYTLHTGDFDVPYVAVARIRPVGESAGDD